MAEDVVMDPCARMHEKVPLGFTLAFAELRRLHEELCHNLALQTPVIEGLVLKAHEDEMASARKAPEGVPVAIDGCDKEKKPQGLVVPCERSGTVDECDEQIAVEDLLVPDERSGVSTTFGSGGDSSFSADVNRFARPSQKRGSSLEYARTTSLTSLTTDDVTVSCNRTEDSPRVSYNNKKRTNFSSVVTNYSVQPEDPVSEGRWTVVTDDPASEGDPVVMRWKILLQRLMGRITFRYADSLLQVKSEWQCDPNDWLSVFTRIGQTQRILKVKSEKSVFAGTEIRSHSCMQKFVCHPDSVISRLVLILGGVALFYDLLMVPFVLCFQIDESQGWFNVMNWALTSFWTCDMLVSAVTGFYAKVVVEMRPYRVLRNYVRTWGVLDFVLNTSDWTSLLLGIFDDEGNNSTSAVLSAGRALKYYRFLRILRMFRLFKLVQRISSYIDGFATEVTLVFLKLLAIIIVIVLVSHYIACIWCAIAYNSADDGNTWMTALQTSELLSPADKMYVYVIAIHWSITQFTPATNNVSPANIRERVYAVFVVFFALIMFSSFLGSLASAMAQLKKIHVERYHEEEQIRKFIFERHVSLNVARRIWNFYRTNYKSPSSSLCYSDIGFLQKLPRMLRMSLHEDISMPVMSRHVAFGLLDQCDHKTLLIVCDRALSESSVRTGHEIFNTGSAATDMIFLNTGSVQYDSPVYPDLENLHAPQIISEVAMWTSWDHIGSLNVSCACNISVLDVASFAKILRDYLRGEVIRCVRRYAKLFVDLVNNNSFLTDVVPNQMSLEFRSSVEGISQESFGAVVMVSRMSNSWEKLGWSFNPSLKQRVHRLTQYMNPTSIRPSWRNSVDSL